jgi:hypothetical protein
LAVSSLLDSAAVVAVITAALAYMSNRYSSRRSATADAMVEALREAQHSSFLRDLGTSDHERLIAEPVTTWAEAFARALPGPEGTERLAGAPANPDSPAHPDNPPHPDSPAHPDRADLLKKWEEVLSWRVEEREARIRLAVVARARDIEAFADFHRSQERRAVIEGWKTVGPVDFEYDRTTTRLIAAVKSARVPTVLRWPNRVARHTPWIRQGLVHDDDIRVLVADYSVRSIGSMLAGEASRILHRNWDARVGCTVPNRDVYPHRWMWDSCFHVIAWTSLDRARALQELHTLLGSRLGSEYGPDSGFIPHMAYCDGEAEGGGIDRGPRPGTSSFTQPPVYMLAIESLGDLTDDQRRPILAGAEQALDWLWRERMMRRVGLLKIVHPWESGADISPRFDDWYGGETMVARHFFDRDLLYDVLVKSTGYDRSGVAESNSSGVSVPSGFNAIAADAARRLYTQTNSPLWRERYEALSRAIDEKLWDEEEELWSDLAFPDHGPRDISGSRRIPTLDGVLGALGTVRRDRAERALGQCVGNGRFAAQYGPRYLPAGDPRYLRDVYWRGPAWPQLNYLLVEAARVHGLDDIAEEIASRTIQGVVKSGWSEYWDPENGEGLGARPQSWTTLALPLYRGLPGIRS